VIYVTCLHHYAREFANNEGFRVPIFSYFLVVGLILTGLLFCADTVIVPSPLPFSVSQKIGLPASYKVPAVAEFQSPSTFASTVEPSSDGIGPRSIFKSPTNGPHL
jgi:hypothetical protein